MNTTTFDTFTSPAIDVGVLREGYADVSKDVTLHYVEAGAGPLVILLHGFPAFWYTWQKQIAPLVKAGFRVVAPDMRGYDLSSKPGKFTDYTADKPAADIRGLIRELGSETATVIGHDWGGSVAWTLAMNNPEVVDRLVILNAAHPRKLNEGLKKPSQLKKSWYFFYFQFPGLPERRARKDNWKFFKEFMDARQPYTPQELKRYEEAWGQPGAAKGMIDYYRAAVRLGSKQKVLPISAPTLVIWGQDDRFLGADLAEPHREDVPNLARVERLPKASHWVHHDEAERVNDLLVDFLANGR